MKKVLITGGMGFIGRVLTRKLLEENPDTHIFILDNLSSCLVNDEICAHPQVTFLEGDFSEWEPEEGATYDEIYHLAAPVGPVKVLEYPGKMLPIIINQLEKAARIALKTGAKLMFISSSEVYGAHARKAISEDADPIVPSKTTVRLEYGIAKLAGEIMLKNLSEATGLKYNAVRPFNIVGPGQNHKSGFVIPRFLRYALDGDPITVYGDGKMVRTFTHVQDFVEALIAVMESDSTGEVYNIGHPNNTMSVLELARRIKDAVESESDIVLVNPKELHGKTFEEAWDKIPDVSKIKERVGWEPKYSIGDMFKEMKEMREKYLIRF